MIWRFPGGLGLNVVRAVDAIISADSGACCDAEAAALVWYGAELLRCRAGDEPDIG